MTNHKVDRQESSVSGKDSEATQSAQAEREEVGLEWGSALPPPLPGEADHPTVRQSHHLTKPSSLSLGET